MNPYQAAMVATGDFQTAPSARPSGAAASAFVRRLFGLLLMLVVVLVSHATRAAEYDPQLCPDAQRIVADVSATLARPKAEAAKSGKPALPIVCTICCQNVPAAEMPEPRLRETAALVHVVYVAPRQPASPGGAPEEMLRPPRG